VILSRCADGGPLHQWIFGGGFEDGDTSSFNGSTVVTRSIALGEPVIYVSANYRVNGMFVMNGIESVANVTRLLAYHSFWI
jgi:acetylcholinesterase